MAIRNTNFPGATTNWSSGELGLSSKDLNDTFTVNLDLIYLNTSSLKIIMTIFDIFDEAKSNKKDIVVNWFYDKDNDLALECGEEFKEGLSFPFNIIEKES